MKCFYHSSDSDGHCSGAIVKFHYPECEMWPIDYGDTFPMNKIKDGETVYMVDFALQPFDQMIELTKKCKLIWIDHHKTALEEAEKRGFVVRGLRRIGIGACSLVWEFINPHLPIPKPVKLLAEYDVWDHSDPDTLPFQYGMRMRETDPATEEGMKLWEKLFESYGRVVFNVILRQGKIILEYQKQIDAKYCSRYAYPVTFEGYKALVLNRGIANSMTFENAPGAKDADIFITYAFTGRSWIVSLYANKPEDIDVSEMAKKYGGGGHKGAAGFTCSDRQFPPELKNTKD